MSAEESIYLKRLKEWVAKDQDSRLFLPLAEEYWKRDVTDVAIGIVEEGLKKHPDFTAARCCLALWYLSKDRPLDAELQLSTIVEKNPEAVPAHGILARLRTRLGRTEQALAGYRRILALRPHDTEARRALGDQPSGGGDGTESVSPGARTEGGAPGPSAHVTDTARVREAESALSLGHHSRAFDLYTSILSESPEIWKIVQGRDEARTLLLAAQQERKRLALNRLDRLRDTVRSRYKHTPQPGTVKD